jgi:hypothetical protein
MAYTKIAGECRRGDDCATVYLTDRDTAVIQGYVLPYLDGRKVPHGEVLAEIPLEVLKEAARVVGR